MIFSDVSIRDAIEKDWIGVDPMPADRMFQPASIDLLLSGDFVEPYSEKVITAEKYYTLVPGECMLASTIERISLRPWVVARVEGKSSWGRRFLMVHSTAGFIDPGFTGRITLELVNLSQCPILLTVGEPICQISFAHMDTAARRPYGHPEVGSHYQDQPGTVASALPWS